jgi:nicotinamidase/pyrazinamidase
MTKCALIIGDMQHDFVTTSGALYIGDQVEQTKSNVLKLLDGVTFDKVLLIQDWHVIDDPEFNIWGVHCIQETYGAEVISEIAKFGDYRIKKRRYSAFFGTDLDLYLRERDLSHVVVVGVMANVCVLHTAGDACARGYTTTVVSDCVETSSEYEKAYALYHIKNVFGAHVVDLEDVLKSS